MENNNLNKKWTPSAIYYRILTLCDAFGWSINRLAELSDVTPSTIYSYRYRNSVPKLETLIIICDTMNISLSEFFDEEDKNKWEVSKVINSLSEKSRYLLVEVAKLMK